MSKQPKVWLAVLLTLLACVCLAHAIVDKDGDGMSDVWQQKYGLPLDGSLDPNADPDGDGWTNLEESIAGTDPLSGEPPDGVLQTHITQNPAVPGVFVVSWPTFAGKQYTLYVSPDMTGGSWTQVGEPVIGDSTPIEMAIDTTGSTPPPDRLFWRVSVADVDSDGDGLSDYEEGILGTDPHNPDTDGDGYLDSSEHDKGTNPNDPADHPTVEWFIVEGNKGPGDPKTESRTYTVKRGETRVLVIATYSEEYPDYTGYGSEYNDTLQWDVVPSTGLHISDSINVNDRNEDWINDETIGVTLAGLAPVHIEVVKVIQATTEDVTITASLTATNVSDALLPSSVIMALIPVRIEADAGVAGVVGDMVPSNKGVSGEHHFVTAKQNAIISDNDVKLVATGLEDAAWITPGDPNQLVEWDPGSSGSAGADATRWKVPRAATGKFPVKIRTIAAYGPEEAYKLNVWATWVNITDAVTDGQTYPFMRNPSDTVDGDGHPVLLLRGDAKYLFDCSPASMFDSAQDIPDLNELKTVDPPGGTQVWPPHAALSRGAKFCFDPSRQVRVVKKSSDPDVLSSLQAAGADISAYPTNPVEGNDDPTVVGEGFPYGSSPTLMTDVDEPRMEIPHALGPNGATVLELAQFQEFARVQIGSMWYVCSDYHTEEVTFKIKKVADKWQDDGSTFVTGNSSTFPPP